METRLDGARRGIDSGSFTDLNRLSQLKVGEDRDGEENIRKVAQEFESLFLNEMLKSMRSANDVLAKDNPLNSQATKQYQEMHDQQLSVSLAKDGGGIGLADVLVRQLSKQVEPTSSAKANPFAQVEATQSSSWPSKPSAVVDAQRDDSKLLSQRRLGLPGRTGDRQSAQQAVVGEGSPVLFNGQAAPINEGEQTWMQAQSFAAPSSQPLVINGVEAQASNSLSKTRFSSPEEFISTMMPMAEKAAKRLGVEARYLVAQAALETGWGKSMIKRDDGTNSHNLFGIKATNWSGDAAKARTTEYINGQATKQVEGFRAYSSFEHSFDDFVSLLQKNDRYQAAINTGGDSERFVRELQKAGYATDPQYARKVSQIARRVQTYQTVADAGSSATIKTRG